MDGHVNVDQDFAEEVPSAHDLAPEIDSVALARLMDEVRNAEEVQPTAYNRMHNRHNRS